MSEPLRLPPTFGSKVRFLVGGALNTALTYLIYLVLQWVMSYQLAFLAAYLSGIVLSYFINASLVFRQPLSWGTALRFPLVYLVQYVLGAILLALLVETLGMDARIAPLAVVVLLLPATYLMTKRALAQSKEAA